MARVRVGLGMRFNSCEGKGLLVCDPVRSELGSDLVHAFSVLSAVNDVGLLGLDRRRIAIPPRDPPTNQQTYQKLVGSDLRGFRRDVRFLRLKLGFGITI